MVVKFQQIAEQNTVRLGDSDRPDSEFSFRQSGHALGIQIWGCSLFYKRKLWASKSAGAKGDVPYICIPCILRYPKVRMISFIRKISEIKHTSSNFSPQLKEDLKAVSNFIQFNQAHLSISLLTWGKRQKKVHKFQSPI